MNTINLVHANMMRMGNLSTKFVEYRGIQPKGCHIGRQRRVINSPDIAERTQDGVDGVAAVAASADLETYRLLIDASTD